MIRELRLLAVLVLKDISVESRRMHEIATILAFPLAGSLTFSILMGEGNGPEPLAFTLLIIILSTFFITTMTFIRELEKGTLYGLKSLPITPTLVFAAKFLYTFIMVSTASLATLACIWFFTGLPQIDILQITLLIVMASLNLSGISSLVSALTMYSEGKFLLIPLITLIYSFPVIILSASALNTLMLGEPITSQLKILGLHFAAFTLFASLLSDIIVGE